MTSRCIGNWSTWRNCQWNNNKGHGASAVRDGLSSVAPILKKRFPRSWPLYVAVLYVESLPANIIINHGEFSCYKTHYSTNTHLSSRTLTLLALWLVVGPQKLLLAPKFGLLTCLIKSRIPNWPYSTIRRRAAGSQVAKPNSTRAAGAGGSSNTMLKLYTDDSPGLRVYVAKHNQFSECLWEFWTEIRSSSSFYPCLSLAPSSFYIFQPRLFGRLRNNLGACPTNEYGGMVVNYQN